MKRYLLKGFIFVFLPGMLYAAELRDKRLPSERLMEDNKIQVQQFAPPPPREALSETQINRIFELDSAFRAAITGRCEIISSGDISARLARQTTLFGNTLYRRHLETYREVCETD